MKSYAEPRPELSALSNSNATQAWIVAGWFALTLTLGCAFIYIAFVK